MLPSRQSAQRLPRQACTIRSCRLIGAGGGPADLSNSIKFKHHHACLTLREDRRRYCSAGWSKFGTDGTFMAYQGLFRLHAGPSPSFSDKDSQQEGGLKHLQT